MRRPPAASLFVAVVAMLLIGAIAGPASAATAKPKTLKLVRTWSYVGPRGPLAGATVRLTDRTGRRIATCKSGSQGTCILDLRRVRNVRLPLEVSTSGGTVIGKRFRGHLHARAFDATTDGGIIQLNVISTAATGMAADRRGYDRAVKRVRRALGIPSAAPADYLRLRNGHVGFRQLGRAAVRAGGFDALAADIAKLAESGARLKGLRPKNANSSGAVRVRIAAASAARASVRQSTAPTCSYPIPSTPQGSSTSTEVITDVAQVGSAVLLDAAGVPEADMVVGMALAPLGQGSSTSDAQIAAIQDDLACVGEDLNYLTVAVNNIQESLDVAGATDCENDLNGTNAWQGYQYLINNADTDPINSSNSSLMNVYLPVWGSIQTQCGGAIDTMLFGQPSTGSSSSSSGGAWQQLVSNTLGTGKWYAQPQVQALQTFLSTWAGYEYEQFVLSNESENSLGAYEAARGSAGVATTTVNGQVAIQTNAAGNALCSTGSTSSTKSYCVWANNIVQAYPPNLYSDEIGTVTTGNAVNTIPGGMVAPNPLANATYAATSSSLTDSNTSAKGSASATAMNPGWAWNYYLNFTKGSSSSYTNNLTMYYFTGGTPTCQKQYQSPCPIAGQDVPNFHQNAVTWFANLGVNPNGYGSAVETFQNPQVTTRQPAAWSDVSDLGSAGAGGQSATTVFYWAVNQLGGSYQPWSSISASQVLYMTADTGSYFDGLYDSFTDGGDKPVTVAWKGNLGSTQSSTNYGKPTGIPSTPVFAFLTKRPWWAGASTAAKYVRPTPPMPS